MLNLFKIIIFLQLIFWPEMKADDYYNNEIVQGYETKCILPSPVDNGKYSISNSTTGDFMESTPGDLVENGTIIIHECNHGYYANSIPVDICRDGKWEDRFRGCITNNNCDLPEFPLNGNYEVTGYSITTVTPGQPVAEYTILTFSCAPLYVLVDAKKVVCIEGAWTSDPPTCKLNNNCDLPEFPQNGNYEITGYLITAVTPGQQVAEYTILTFSCAPLYDLVDAKRAICIAGAWTSDPPTCKRSNGCIVPDPPANGQSELIGDNIAALSGEIVEEGTTLIYICDPGYSQNDRQMTYCHNGYWIGGPVECIDYTSELTPFKDCSDVSGLSGVYNIKPNEQTGTIAVYCELNLKGKKWTVIQQRFDGSVDFYRDYESYKYFFGDAHGNYWIGLENIHQITKNEDHELYVELETHDGHKASARYKTFSVGPAIWGYQLTVYTFDNRSGADDALYSNNGFKFSTFDNDHDELHNVNCAERFHGGWWYGWCGVSNLNGRYFDTGVNLEESMHWFPWFRKYESLKSTRMLVRKN